MKLIRLAAAVLNQTPLDWAHNSANARAAIADAERRFGMPPTGRAGQKIYRALGGR